MDQTTRQQLVGEIYHYGQLTVALALAQQSPDAFDRVERATRDVAEQVVKIQALLDGI